MKRFSVLLLLVVALFAVPAFASDRPAPEAHEPRARALSLGGQEKSPAPATAVPSKAEGPAAKVSAVPVPAEMQELLADRDLLSAEIERIINAEGDAVKIPVSLRTLSARREAKTARFLAWLDAQKIPRDWRAAGWRLDKWVFIPPARPEASGPVPEKKP